MLNDAEVLSLCMQKSKNYKKDLLNLQTLLQAKGSKVGDIERIKSILSSKASDNINLAQKEIELAKQQGIKVISLFNEHYPNGLRGIPDQPLILYVKGSLSLLNAPHLVAVVGTRDPSKIVDAEKFASDSAMFLANKDIVVVSGLALGIDTAAHKGALESTYPQNTIAVMAHGLDMVFPKENEALAQKIITKGGCLISEHKPGTKPINKYYTQRNRLQSGIANATLIVQTTAVRAGTMATANHCIKQNRPLYAFNAPQNTKGFEGNAKLINEKKAQGIDRISDDFIQRLFPDQSAKNNPKPIIFGQGIESFPNFIVPRDGVSTPTEDVISATVEIKTTPQKKRKARDRRIPSNNCQNYDVLTFSGEEAETKGLKRRKYNSDDSDDSDVIILPRKVMRFSN